MTQKQKQRISYLVACASLCLSFLAWLSVLQWHNQELSNEGGIPPDPPTLSRVVDRSKEAVKRLKAAVLSDDEALHESAFDIFEEGIHGDEQGDTEQSDLQDWQLSVAYTITVPALNIRAPVLLPSRQYWDAQQWNLLEEQMQVGLTHGVVAYPHSVTPGRRGSVIIAGHSSPPNERAEQSDFGTVFARLPELQAGDRIFVEQGENALEFEVQSTTVVPATATTILRQQYEESALKLITCFPVGTTKDRLVIEANRVD